MAIEPTGDCPLGAVPQRPRAVLLDSFGTLVAMEPPHVRLAELLGVPADEAEAAFRAEISYYLDHHLAGRDDESLEQLRDECARVLHEALPAAASLDRAIVRQAMLDAIRFDAFSDSA